MVSSTFATSIRRSCTQARGEVCRWARNSRVTVAGLASALAQGGALTVAVHLGPGVRHVDDLFGVAVDLDFTLHDPASVLDAFTSAGLVDVEWYRRGPYGGVEVETERLYVLGHRPS